MKICTNLFIRNRHLKFNNPKNILKLTNIPKKTFFSFISKIRSKNKELIVHPEFGGEKINFDKKINSSDREGSYEDPTLYFITLDKNGIPQIKKTYYESLGVSQKASNPEIKANFLKIARKYHPDKHPESLVNKLLINRPQEIFHSHLQRL
jgi:hypothetical protein